MHYPKLKGVMAEQGITIVELSKMTGISYGSLAPKLRGAFKLTVEDAMKIKNALGTEMRLEELFYDND